MKIDRIKFVISACAIFFSFNQAWSQDISNPDFETYSSCPTGQTQIARATGWRRPTGGTSDYFNDCGYNISTTISPNSGEGFAGAFMETKYSPSGLSNYKEYITNQLSSPMVAGVTYSFSFYIAHLYGASPSAMLPAAISYTDLPIAERGFIGVVFSEVSPTTSNTQGGSTSFGATSIVDTFGSGRVLIPATDTNVYGSGSRNSWIEVTMEYTAVGGEEFITVGQFRPGITSLADSTAAYYLFDNFSSPVPLPVKLNDFRVVSQSGNVILDWNTVSESNSKGFTVEHSQSGDSWRNIGFVASATVDGNSNAVQQYSYTDHNPLPGMNYYRLKQIDIDGNFNYSRVKSVMMELQHSIEVLPNPAKDRITINGLTGTELIRIYSADGRMVKELMADNPSVVIALDNMNTGIYQINVIAASGSVSVSKIIKL